MKGLIVKDFLNLKRQGKMYLLLFAFYGVLGYMQEDSSALIGMITIFVAILPISAMAYDEQAKWDRYAIALPITRTSLVVSKYILAVLLTLMSMVASFAMSFLFGIMKGQLVNVLELGFTTVAIGAVCLVLNGLLLPLLFKYGVEKARTLMFLVMAIPMVLILLAARFASNIAPETVSLVVKLLPVGFLILMVASVLLSVRIYKKKEF